MQFIRVKKKDMLSHRRFTTYLHMVLQFGDYRSIINIGEKRMSYDLNTDL
jgi:hypothetical protein